MAVTLTLDDLVQPTGELSDALFPAGDMETLVTGWLADAAGRVVSVATAQQNDAAAAWVYHRAYRQIADRLAVTPSSLTAGPRTEGYSSDQRKMMADRADYWLGVFSGFNLTTPAAAVPVFFSTVGVTRTWPLTS